MNKKLGTVVLVSDTTKEGARTAFRFRHVATITVPGKAQVLPVFEPLYRISPGVTETSIGEDDEEPCNAAATHSSAREHRPDNYLSLGSPHDARRGSRGPEVLYCWKTLSMLTLDTLVEFYDKGLDCFASGDLDQAMRWFEQAQRTVPEDGPTQVLLQLCRAGRSPGRTWDGVIRFEQK
eukprot:RCo007233